MNALRLLPWINERPAAPQRAKPAEHGCWRDTVPALFRSEAFAEDLLDLHSPPPTPAAMPAAPARLRPGTIPRIASSPSCPTCALPCASCWP